MHIHGKKFLKITTDSPPLIQGLMEKFVLKIFGKFLIRSRESGGTWGKNTTLSVNFLRLI